MEAARRDMSRCGVEREMIAGAGAWSCGFGVGGARALNGGRGQATKANNGKARTVVAPRDAMRQIQEQSTQVQGNAGRVRKRAV